MKFSIPGDILVAALLLNPFPSSLISSSSSSEKIKLLPTAPTAREYLLFDEDGVWFFYYNYFGSFGIINFWWDFLSKCCLVLTPVAGGIMWWCGAAAARPNGDLLLCSDMTISYSIEDREPPLLISASKSSLSSELQSNFRFF